MKVQKPAPYLFYYENQKAILRKFCLCLDKEKKFTLYLSEEILNRTETLFNTYLSFIFFQDISGLIFFCIIYFYCTFRCPAGVGSWASSFIQTPLTYGITESPFANYQINHVLTILATILSPIKAREQFLEDIAQTKDTATEALWVMVDSDGEEDEESTGTSLKENDLVALLNQLPLDNMFRNVLLIQQKDYKVKIIFYCIVLKFLL